MAANDPLGGGFDDTGAAAGAGFAATLEGTAFVALVKLLLSAGLVEATFDGTARGLALETGLGTALSAGEGAAGFPGTAGFATAGRAGILASILDGRGKGSSAFLFVPTACPLAGGAWRTAGDFRSSFLGAAVGTGEAGAWESGV